MSNLSTFLSFPPSPSKSRALASLIDLNPDLARGLLDYLRRTKQECLMGVILLEPWWTQKGFEWIQTMIRGERLVLKKEQAIRFVKLNVKRFCEDRSREVSICNEEGEIVMSRHW